MCSSPVMVDLCRGQSVSGVPVGGQGFEPFGPSGLVSFGPGPCLPPGQFRQRVAVGMGERPVPCVLPTPLGSAQ